MTTGTTGNPAAIQPNIFQQIVERTRRKNELEKELDRVKLDLDALEKQAVDRFMEMGLSSIKTKEGQTVHLQKELFASLISDKEQAHAVLRRHGLEYMVKDNVNGQTLSSWVREQEKEEIPIHPEVEAVLNVKRRLRVRVKSS